MKLFLAFLISMAAFAGNKIFCNDFFDFSPVSNITREGKVLGQGQNAIVRVFTDTKNEKYVVKTYYSDFSHRNSQIQNDLRAFNFLNAYKKRFSFTLPEVSHLGENKMKLSYHPGRTVLDLLTDESTKAEVKKSIEKSYKKMLDEIESCLHDFHSVERTADVLSAENELLTRGAVQIIIKKDNVIVNPETLKLTLIDPH